MTGIVVCALTPAQLAAQLEIDNDVLRGEVARLEDELAHAMDMLCACERIGRARDAASRRGARLMARRVRVLRARRRAWALMGLVAGIAAWCWVVPG